MHPIIRYLEVSRAAIEPSIALTIIGFPLAVQHMKLVPMALRVRFVRRT